ELVAAVDRPVNVLALPGTPPVPELAAMGVKRISVGGAFAFAGLGAVADAARELRDQGTYGYWQQARSGSAAARAAFSSHRRGQSGVQLTPPRPERRSASVLRRQTIPVRPVKQGLDRVSVVVDAGVQIANLAQAPGT